MSPAPAGLTELLGSKFYVRKVSRHVATGGLLLQ